MSFLGRLRFIPGLCLVLFTMLMSAPCLANWTFNLGYHNPPGSKVGVNFLYWSQPLMFEIGIGWIDVDSLDNEDTNEAGNNDATTEEESTDLRVAVAGALNVKYMLTSGGVRPYLQLGVGAGSYVQAGDDTDLGAGIGGLYGGLGLMAGSPQFYAYASYNIHGNSNHNFAQFGIGFDI
ncbi:MAG: hypothetical protein ACOH5I_18925 [Oligoflexus sp.]